MNRKKFYNLIQKSGGFSLLEVLIAIFVLTIGIVGAYTAFGGMLTSSSIAKQRLTAAYLAQEGIEIVRNIRDTNWLQTATAPWTYTVEYFTTSNYGHDCRGSSDGNPYTGYNGGCEADYLTATENESGHALKPILNPSFDSSRPILSIDLVSNSYMYGATSGSPASVFRRQIIVNPTTDGTQSLDVIVNVYWQEKGVKYNFPVEGILYNWWTEQ